MAIAQVGSTTAASATNCGTATASVSKPTGTASGHTIVIRATAHNACCGTDVVTIAIPSGFTPKDGAAFGTTSYGATFVRVADGSEGSTFSVSATGTGGGFNTTQLEVQCYTLSGVDTTTPVDDIQAQNNASSTNAITPTATASVANVYAVSGLHYLGSTAVTPAAGFTSLGTAFGAGVSVYDGSKTLSSSGATGAFTNTLAGAKVTRGVTILFKPAGGAVVVNSWYPVYNDQTRPNIRPKADFVYETVPPYVAPAFIPYALYSDQKRPNYRPQADFVFMAPQPLNKPMPWIPSYPNQVPFFKQQIPAGQVVEPVIPYFKDMRWQPQYSDQKRPNLRPQADFVFGPTLKLNFPMPWQAEYTDLQRPNSRPQADFVFEPPYTIATPLVTLPWLPIYMDQKRPNYRPQVDFTFGPVLPVVSLLPWLPYYPDLARAPAPVKGDSVFEPPFRLNFPLPWIPQYADQVRPNLKVQRDFSFAPIFPLNFPVPWLPQYHVKQALLNTTWLGGAVYPIKFSPAARAFTQWFSLDGL